MRSYRKMTSVLLCLLMVASAVMIFAPAAAGSGMDDEAIQLTFDARKEGYPDWSPDGSRICWSLQTDLPSGIDFGQYGEIWEMAPDGTGKTRILDQSYAGMCQYSNDGSKITYSAAGSSWSSWRYFTAIWTMNADGTGASKIYDVNAHDKWTPTWSPSDDKIAFMWVGAPGGYSLMQMNPDGTNAQYLATPTNAYHPNWGINNEIVFAYIGTDAVRKMAKIDMATNVVTTLTNDDSNPQFPAWSPDGTRIAFSAVDGTGNRDIYVMNADGTEITRITEDPAIDYMPSWSPDGGSIAFSSDRSGNYDIWLLALETPEAPVADIGGPYSGTEGVPIQFDASASYDTDGSIVRYDWDMDGDGFFEMEDAGLAPQHTWGDDYSGDVCLKVLDSDDIWSESACTTVSVENTAPSVSLDLAEMTVAMDLAVAGTASAKLTLSVYEDDILFGELMIIRTVGSPGTNLKSGSIPDVLNPSKQYRAIVTYESITAVGKLYLDRHGLLPVGSRPLRASSLSSIDAIDNNVVPNAGANPVWLEMNCDGKAPVRLRHTFNWKAMAPWEVDLDSHFSGCLFESQVNVEDPGSDDIHIEYVYGTQSAEVIYYNDGNSTDGYPSPEINPVSLTDIASFRYEYAASLDVTVTDDDGGASSI